MSYVGRGYYFYVTGWVPEHKDARSVDAKLIARYGIAISKWTRARRKRIGLANTQYIRHGRFFVLLATNGHHRFFNDEATMIQDVRRTPIKYAGYSVSVRGGHSHVQIARDVYKGLKARCLEIAIRKPKTIIERELQGFAFEPYAPVRRQMLALIRATNRARTIAGLPQLSNRILDLHRRIQRPFAWS